MKKILHDERNEESVFINTVKIVTLQLYNAYQVHRYYISIKAVYFGIFFQVNACNISVNLVQILH